MKRDSLKGRLRSYIIVGLIEIVTLGVPQLFRLNQLLFFLASVIAAIEIIAAYRNPSRLRVVGFYDNRADVSPFDPTATYVMMEVAVVLGGGLSYLFLHNRWTAIVITVGCVACDTLAYCIGKLLGQKIVYTKPFPEISPGKTWEGTVGGGICTILILVALCAVTGHLAPNVASSFEFTAIFFLAPICILGDLAASFVKRLLDIKDSADCVHNIRLLKGPELIMRGFGGYLDRLDSICLVSIVLSLSIATTI